MGDFLSLFSGIGGLDLGLERAGWRCVGQVEIESYRRGVLERWWPDVPRWRDVRQFDPVGFAANADSRPSGTDADARSGEGAGPQHPQHPDLICGGFPCQDLSVAGRRAGLQGARSSLFFEFARIVGTLRPTWLLVENVPGLLSSHRGRDFAVVLATLAELGYGVCWRVLDSRYFGVPQRRRRVFIVGHLGARSPEPFLPFLQGGVGDSQASREAGKGVANVVEGRPDLSSRVAGTFGALAQGGFRTTDIDIMGAFVTRDVAYSLRADPGGTGQGHNTNYVAFQQNQRNEVRDLGNVAGALSAQPGMKQQNYLADTAVRRLTPVECCRLQGFPDDWLGGTEPPDSPKYAALGDAVTVPVAEWIGRALMQSSTS